MRRIASSGGLLLSFFLNLFLNWGWGALALVLFVLRGWFSIPLFVPFAALGVWFFVSVVTFILITWGARNSSSLPANRENKNPYSAKTADMFEKINNTDKE